MTYGRVASSSGAEILASLRKRQSGGSLPYAFPIFRGRYRTGGGRNQIGGRRKRKKKCTVQVGGRKRGRRRKLIKGGNILRFDCD
jgi:hypothetical protein